MNKMSDGYPFIFVMADYSEADSLLIRTLQYRFKSAKSNHTYIVRVECYTQHVYCLKFFDKSVSLSKNKYSLRTNTFEPRTIMYTLYHIMASLLKHDGLASFFFIGAEDEKDGPGATTRRYRIYRRFVSSVVSDNLFEHYRVNDLSLYILLNKATDYDHKQLVAKIMDEVKRAYSN